MLCVVFVGNAAFEMDATGAYGPLGSIPSHRTMFCPRTGEIWARWLWDGVPQEKALWFVEYATREGQERRRTQEVPGSLLQEGHDYVPGFFPDDLVEREFFIHVAYARRYLGWTKSAASQK